MQDSLGERLRDSGARVLVTNPRMAERIPLIDLPRPRVILLVGAVNISLHPWKLSWEEEMAKASSQSEIEWVNLEDPLYLIYTYGSGGKPKGVLHVHRDMVGHFMTGRWVLDLREGDVLWTTADPGWITGTVYGAFAPWLCGVETFVRGGRFDIEGWSRSIESNRVSVWYTAPSVFRRLMGKGEEVLKRHDLSSLRHLLSVGEPLPSEVVYWARRVFKIPDPRYLVDDGDRDDHDRQLSEHADKTRIYRKTVSRNEGCNPGFPRRGTSSHDPGKAGYRKGMAGHDEADLAG